MKKKIVFLIISIVMVSFFSLILLFLVNGVNSDKLTKEINNVVHVQGLPVFFEVTDQRIVGINIDTDGLKFGTIMQGNFARRDITIINPFQIPIDVEIDFSDNILEITEISQDSFSLDVDDSLKVSITVTIDEDIEIGEYEGVLMVTMKRADIS